MESPDLCGRQPSPSLHDNNKRKRDAKSQYITSMIQANPKILLAASPIFQGLTQQQLPFSVAVTGSLTEVYYEASIKLPLPDGREAWGSGYAKTKKLAERNAAVDACNKLNELNFLVGECNSNSTAANADVGWGENPKNILIKTVAFQNMCCGKGARPLPVTVRSSGPDHLKTFIAELAVPIPGKREPFMAIGKGRNKGEAERMCCYAACEKLHEEGFLNKEGSFAGSPASSFTKAYQSQQSERPAIVGLRENELTMVVDALQRLNDDVDMDFVQRMSQQSFPFEEQSEVNMQKEESRMPLNHVGKEQLASENDAWCLEAKQRLSSPNMSDQWKARKSLPAWRQKQKIVDLVANNQVVVLTGETGCGKTTQVPQFLLEDFEMDGASAEVHIVVTQPRRIAAISVAERVAWERGEPLGNSVGYSIRLENVLPRPRGSILYCTTGVLLRRLQRSDGVAGISHIVIDEVHERDVYTDCLLVVVREILQCNTSLRVIIMSATLDSDIYTRYFNRCPTINIPGMMHPVEVYYLEDLENVMGRSSFIRSRLEKTRITDDEDVDVDLVATVITSTVDTFAKTDGAVLCFLPGLDHILMVRDKLQRMPSSRYMTIIPFHSQLPAGEQRAVFSRMPAGLRKVVLSTNIAETSVTIDDVVYVIDSGKIKEKQFDPSRNMNMLRVQWTSQASARQRQGRAGRVRAGFCFRLYTREVFASMLVHQVPEMQRVPLDDLCLQIKAIVTPTAAAETALADCQSQNSDIATFLSKALQPPKIHAVHAAVELLQDLGAIDLNENLTPMGMILSKLTVPPRFGKMLVYGALIGCLEPLLTIAAAACFRDPFVAPVNRRAEADKMRESFSVGVLYGSDHLALVNAFEQWCVSCSHGEGNIFCEESFLAHPTMKLIAGMRQQLKRTLVEAGIQEEGIRLRPEASMHAARCLLVAGLYPNIACSELCRELRGTKNASKNAYRWKMGFKVRNGRILIHPTSVVSDKQLKTESNCYLAFHEKVQTSQIFARGCTLLPSLPLVLMGWAVNHSSEPPPPEFGRDWMLLEADGWLKFVIHRRDGSVLLQLREAFHRVLGRWVCGVSHTDAERQVIRVVIALLEASCDEMLCTIA